METIYGPMGWTGVKTSERFPLAFSKFDIGPCWRYVQCTKPKVVVIVIGYNEIAFPD